MQGSRPEPYEVTIEVEAADAAGLEAAWPPSSPRSASSRRSSWPARCRRTSRRASRAPGCRCSPRAARDLQTDCSCPDWSNPCKHIAAVYYLLGEEFDRDPFLIFRLRGMDRDEFTSILFDSGAAAGPAAEPAAEPEPLTPEPQRFWAAPQMPADLLAVVEIPKVAAAIPRRLGNIQFWRGELPLVEALEPVYEKSARRGEALVLGEKSTQ